MELQTFAKWWDESKNDDNTVTTIMAYDYAPATLYSPAEWSENEVEIDYDSISDSVVMSGRLMDIDEFYAIIEAEIYKKNYDSYVDML